MESALKTKLASRGWHFYEKTSRKSQQKEHSLHGEKESNIIALMHNSYAVA